MALNQTLDRSASTVVVSGDTGARANGRDEVTITVTAKDTSAAVIPYAEVFIEEQAGRHFISDSALPAAPAEVDRLRGPDPTVTDANGVAVIKVKSFYEGSLNFKVYVGAPQGGTTGEAVGSAVFDGSATIKQKTVAADVGHSGLPVSTFTGDQTIDAAWLVANNGNRSTITNFLFTGGTVTVDTEVSFVNCEFDAGGSDYAVVCEYPSVALPQVGTFHFKACTIRNASLACLRGHRVHMSQCLIEESEAHGIEITKRSGTGNEAVSISDTLIRKVGLGGFSSAPQGYGVHCTDPRFLTFTGVNVECPYHSTGGAVPGYYPLGAVYVGAVTEPITQFYFSKSWIDGGVLLDDGGFGVGPEGQMFSPNIFGRNYNPAVPMFDTTDVHSLWTKGQMWMDTGALVPNRAETGTQVRAFTGTRDNNLWLRGDPLTAGASFTMDPAYALVSLDATRFILNLD